MVDLPPADVDSIVVTAPWLAPLGGDAAFDVIRIEPANLRQAQRLDEALKQAPGVSLFRRNGSGAANPTTQGLSMRAIAPSGAGRTLVTLDGAPVNDPFGGWVIWSALPPEGLGKATLVRGAGAGPYGAGALTGVVALQEAEAGPALSAFDVSAGTRDSYRGAAVVGGPGVVLSAYLERSDGYTPVRGAQRGAADQPLKFNAKSLAFRVQHEFGDVAASARLGVYEERRGAGLLGAGSIASGASAVFTLARPAAEGVGGWRAQAWARASDLANSSVAVAAGRVGTTPANDQYATPAEGYGLNAAVQGRLSGVSWEAGVDGRLTEGVERERFRYMGGFTRGREAGGRTSVVGAYVEAVAEQGPWLLTGGGRVDAWRSSRAIRRERDLANNAILLDQGAPGASGTTPTARLGMRYAVTPDIWLRSAAYAAFRPPTLNELHRPFRVGNDVTEANPLLKPETLQGAEVGLGGTGWGLTGFYNRLKDPITNVTIGFGPATFPTAGLIPAGGVLRQRQNAGRITAWGVEGDASGALSSDLDWRAAFSATRARVDGGSANPQLTGKRPAQAPALTVAAGADWRPVERLSLSADLRYESKRYEDDLNSRVLGAGVQLDARAGWRLASRLEVYVAAENLTDARIETGETADGVSSYATPRTLRIGVAYRR